jgi:hypothetical protein
MFFTHGLRFSRFDPDLYEEYAVFGGQRQFVGVLDRDRS